MNTKNLIGKILVGLQGLITIVFMVMVLILDMLPLKYVLAISFVLVLLWVITAITQKFKKSRIAGMIYAVIIVLALLLGAIYMWKAHSVINEVTSSVIYKVSDVSVVVLSDSPAEGLQDLDGKTFGILSKVDRVNTNLSLEKLKEHYTQSVTTKEYDGFIDQAQALFDGKIDAMIMNEAYRPVLSECFSGFDINTKVIDAFTYTEEVVQEDKTPSTDTIEPFTVFLSGNDAAGEVMLSDGRTDVNILATVNPSTRQIVLTTTPRDYYVELPFYSGCMDKLTHAGIYGIDCSIETLENLYDIDIDYYVRINFSGFQSIVEALGGVNVYSEYTFSTGKYSFTQGYNYVNGPAALAFVRERYSFESGDVQRGKNQMAMIAAIVDKISSPAILTNYMGMMDSLSSCFITNIPRETISEMVKLMLNEGGSWNIVTNSVNGYGNMLPTYSGGSQELSVMEQDPAAVQEAHDMIKACENGEIVSAPAK